MPDVHDGAGTPRVGDAVIHTEDIAMQVRCLACMREQYGPAVWDYSQGLARCHHCGWVTVPMSKETYALALHAVHRLKDAEDGGGTDMPLWPTTPA